MPVIDIIDASGNDYRYNLPEDGSVLLIGSGEDCSVSLPHIADLLPQHCTIALQEEGYVVTIATEGATLLTEGQPTAAAILVPRAVYNIGSAMLMFDDGSAETAQAAPAEAPAEEMPAEEAPAEEMPAEEAPAEEEPAAAPARKKKKKTKHSGSADTSFLGGVSYTEEDSALHIILRRLYVIAILAAAFLAGLTMRYWMITGEYLIDELLK